MSKRWTAADAEYLRQYYTTASRARLLTRLPHTWHSIKNKALRMGLRRPRRYAPFYFWQNNGHREKLKRMYTTAPWPQILAAFPQFTKTAIRATAYKLGYHRPGVLHRTRPETRVDPVTRALTERRMMIGMTQAALAKKLGVALSTIRAAERGKSNFGYHRLLRWCRLLGVQLACAPIVNPLARLAAADMARFKREDEKRERLAA